MIKRTAEACAAKHGKHCKSCGCWFVHRDRVYCSLECRKSSVAKPVRFACSHCGKEGVRDPHKVKNPERMFCSKQCQNAFQKTNYADYQNTAALPISKTRTKVAKSKWYAKRRKERLTNSQSAGWWLKCMECSSRIMRSVEISEWDRRCDSAASMMRKRREPVFRLEAIRVLTWNRTIAKNKRRLWVDDRPKDQIEWSKKINHTAKACKRRFAARSKDAIGRCGTNTTETLQWLLPFAE